MKERQTIYDKKVIQILEMMKYMTRDDVAKEMNYKDWKGMDSYMRRKNFLYDNKIKEYIPTNTEPKVISNASTYTPIRVLNIISSFSNLDADPMLVAKQSGFNNHKDMAIYMKEKGYEWDIAKNNYVKSSEYIINEYEKILEEFPLSKEETSFDSFNEYMPFLRFLYEKRDEIYQLISGTKEDGKIPRYALPGMVRTKAIYMNDTIGRFVGEFSKEKNITQREIVEAALIEYLRKYGYKSEVDSFIRNG